MKSKRATLKDVAEHVGVHYSTVSRALDLQGDHRITDEVRARVRAAVEELGYRHNGVASSLRKNSNMIIGIVVPDITNHLFSPIIKGVEDMVSKHGYVSLIGNTDDDPARGRVLMDTFMTRGIDGMIVASALRVDEALSSLANDGVPIVTVNSRVDDDGVSSVLHKDHRGISALVEHLVELGHKKIAYISGPQDWSTSRERLSAYKRAVARYDLDTSEELIVFSNAFREGEGERCAEILVKSKVAFTAVMAANDLLAMGAMAVLLRNGLQCPRDVSVTGFNDIPLAERWTPPLTTVRVEPYLAGQRAAEMLLLAMQSKPEEREAQHVLLPVGLVVRGSTGPASRKPNLRQKKQPVITPAV